MKFGIRDSGTRRSALSRSMPSARMRSGESERSFPTAYHAGRVPSARSSMSRLRPT